jgi:hypothetical protein
MKSFLIKEDRSIESFDNRSLQNAIQENIDLMRERVSSEITNNCSIITQQNAALGIYSTERCEAIKSYIAACRNEYLRCKALILAAQTNDESDAVQFVTPEVPTGL